jgi:ABC-type Fe3+ transport system permease subunit
MERQSNELLLITLMAILVITVVFSYWFGRSGKRKTSHTTNPIPYDQPNSILAAMAAKRPIPMRLLSG